MDEKAFMDYRLKKNRRDAFLYWYKWSLENKDCDPPIWLLNYLFNRFEHNLEQKYWIAWIYGTTYHLPTAWVIWNEFPDFELVDLQRLKDWNDKNYHRLRYQTDTKYNKGYLPQQFESYKNWIEHNNESKTQSEKLQKYNYKFKCLWSDVIKNLFKFGRYATWFYLQTLHQCCDLKVYPDNLKLDDFNGSSSHRNGLCLALGKDDWCSKKLSRDMYQYLEYEANLLNEDMLTTYNIKTDLYNLETCLCSFKKIFRKTNGRYLGYYLDRQAEEITKVENDGWNGVDWQVFWDARRETLAEPLYESNNVKKHLYKNFIETGKLESVI